MIHQVTGGVEGHCLPVVHGDPHLDEIGVEYHAIRRVGIIDGQHAVVQAIVPLNKPRQVVLVHDPIAHLQGFLDRQAAFPDGAGMDEILDKTARFGHVDAEVVAGEGVAGDRPAHVAGGLQLAGIPVAGLGQSGIAADGGFALEQLRLLLLNVIGEGAVVNQRGIVLEALLHIVEATVDIGSGDFGGLRRVIKGQQPGLGLVLHARHLVIHLVGIGGQSLHRGGFLIGNAAPRGHPVG